MAPDGAKHEAFRKQVKGYSNGALRRAPRAFEKLIEEHEEKLQ